MELGGGNLENTLERADNVYVTLATSRAHKLAAVGAAGTRLARSGRNWQREAEAKVMEVAAEAMCQPIRTSKQTTPVVKRQTPQLPKKLEAILDFPTPQ